MTPQELGKRFINEGIGGIAPTIKDAFTQLEKAIHNSNAANADKLWITVCVATLMNTIGKELTEMPVPDTIPEYKSEGEVCRDALVIFNGACNATAIAGSLAGMCKYLMHITRSTEKVNTHPAVSLVLTQLNHLNNSLARDVFEDINYCEDNKEG